VTDSTVTAGDVMMGVTVYLPDGTKATGTFNIWALTIDELQAL